MTLGKDFYPHDDRIMEKKSELFAWEKKIQAHVMLLVGG